MTRRWLSLLLLFGTALAAPSWQDDAALMDSLSQVHPRMRASWLRERGLDDSYYTTFHTPNSDGLREVGRWPWGPSWELCGRDSLLFLGSGSGVRILSIMDSTRPRMLGQINARGLVSQLVVQDSLLFVACGGWGAQVYSVTDPAHPRELGSMDAVIYDLAVVDTLCFTLGVISGSSATDSLRVYSIADPRQPRQLSAIRDSGYTLAVTNGHAFSGGRWVMNIYDARNPRAPQWVNSWGGSTMVLAAEGNKLYHLDVDPNLLRILNVSDPQSITEFGRVTDLGGDAIYVADEYAYTGDQYVKGFVVVDVSDSTRPVELGNVGMDGWECDPFVFQPRSYAYLATHWGGLAVIDIHDPAHPRIDSAWFASDAAVDVHADGSRLYVANTKAGLQIVNISDPTSPQTLARYDTAGQLPQLHTVTARDSFAYISWAPPPFRVVDVGDPVRPRFVGSCWVTNIPEDMVLRDSFVYCAEANRFQIVNVARPRQPVLVGSCNGDGVAIVVRDTFAYTGAGAVRVTNVARPDSPFVVTTIGRASPDLSIVDSILFCNPGPAIWYSLANPAVPVPIDSIDMGHWITAMAAVDRTVYACSGPTYTTLYAISIADLHQPRVIAQASLPYTANRITYAAPYLYLSCWEAGVCIFDSAQVAVAEPRPEPKPRESAQFGLPSVAGGALRVEAGGGRVRLYDTAGKSAAELQSGVHDVSRIPAGVYFVRTDSGQVHKLILQR